MSYETAPATQLVATHCACCARPLVDAKSVETGVGPECRKRHGYDKPDQDVDLETACAIALLHTESAVREEEAQKLAACKTTREVANRIVYQIAAEQTGEHVAALINALRGIGFERLAARISDRIATIELTFDEGTRDYLVTSPYSEEAVSRFRALPQTTRRWDKQAKAWRVHESAKGQLFHALRAVFPGCWASGPKGLFRLAPLGLKAA